MLESLYWALFIAGYCTVAFLCLWLSKKFFDLITPYSLDLQLTDRDNPAVGILLAGYIAGVSCIIGGTYWGEGAALPSLQEFIMGLGPVLFYTAMGIITLFIAGIINDKVVLKKFNNTQEIIERENCAVALAMAGTFIGSGLVIAGSIAGAIDLRSMLMGVVLGQIALLIFSYIYQMATAYDFKHEIGENKNIPAGVAFGANLVAYSMILAKGIFADAEVIGVVERSWHFLFAAVGGIIVLLITRVVCDKIFLPGVSLSDEISKDCNLNAGFIEGVLAISAGMVLTLCL